MPPIDRAPEAPPRAKGLTTVLVVLLVTATVAGGALAAVTATQIRRDARSADERLLERAVLAVQTVMSSSTSSLYGAEVVVVPDGGIDRFTAFAADVVNRSNLTTIALVERITHDQRPALEERLGTSVTRLIDGALTPAPVLDVYDVVTAVIPLSPEPSIVIGFDLGSESNIAMAVERAERGEIVSVSPLLPVTDGDSTIILVIAVHDVDGDRVIGFVVSFLDAVEVLADARAILGGNAGLSIEDGEQDIATVGNLSPSARSAPAEIGGRVWTIRADDGEPTSYAIPLTIAIATSVLVTAIGLLVVRRLRDQREEVAEGRSALATAELVNRLARASSQAEVIDIVAELVPPSTGATEAEFVVLDDPGGDADATTFESGNPVTSRRHQSARAVLPIFRGGKVVGQLSVRWMGPRQFDLEERTHLATIATITGQVLERVHLTDSEHRLVQGLRQMTLEAPDVIAGLDVAIAYRSSVEGLTLGGDWYDIVEQDDGLVAFVVGDVAGHDVDAVVEMTEVRTVLRTLLSTGYSPSACMARADAILAGRPGVRMATAVIGVIDVAGDRLRYVSAGHPPMVLRSPDGSAVLLSAGRRSVLGFDLEAGVKEEVVPFGPGSVVVAYTDGLVERRDEPIDDGIERLVEAMRLIDGSETAGHVCERVLAGMLGEALDDGLLDDVATVTIRHVPTI